VLAVAIYAKLTLEDLSALDLSYAPPYSSANDPLQMAAFAARNDMVGFSKFITAQEALPLIKENSATVLDVRTFNEFVQGHIRGSIHIPVDELRDRIDEIPESQLLIVSKAGFEGHLAYRQLVEKRSSDIKYVSGGFTSMQLIKEFNELIEEGE